MGQCCSSSQQNISAAAPASAPAAAPNAPQPSHPRAVEGAVPLEEIEPMTMSELISKRAEFWDTRVQGRKHIWQTLRMASEAEEETAQAICESAGITPLGESNNSSLYCDDHGEIYEMPMFLLRIPDNIIHEERGSIVKPRDADYEKAGSVELQFRVRLSSGGDISLKMPGRTSILQLKQEVEKRVQAPAECQMVVFRGKMLKDDGSLLDYIENDSLVQVMVRKP